jgi:hypothetical protein
MSKVIKYQLSPEERTKYSNVRRSEARRTPVLVPPNETRQVTVPLTNAWSALAAIYIGLEYEYWENEKLFRTISQKAYLNKYNGQWKTVQDFLEAEFQSPKQYQEAFILRFGPREYHGNLLPAIQRLREVLKFKASVERKEKPVKYPQFHRGYKDKGTLRLSHEKHGIPDYSSDPERPDRRSLVYHPLLRDVDRKLDEGDAEKTRPRKEGET